MQGESVSPSFNLPISLLIVDDEKNMVVELSEAFSDNGYVVHGANSAEEALKLLCAHRDIGVMISDIRMPVCDGIELTKLAFGKRSEEDALEVILITGHATLTDTAAAIPNGTFDLLRKPFRLNTILDVTAQAMMRSFSRREAVSAVANSA
jgi:DNA-binding NtrC family response regulator